VRRLVAFFVNHTLFGDLLTFAVIGFGIFSLFVIRREVFPNVNFDVVSVNTIFLGAGAEEVEKLVTNPLEQDMKELEGIKRLQSVSVEGRSSIVIYLDPDQTNAKESKSDIQDVVDRFGELPEGAEKPVVTELDSSLTPIIEVSIASRMPPIELRKVAKKLEEHIELLPGVARVVHRGLRDVEIRVEVSKEKLNRYQLSLEDVVSALKRQNVSIPGGSVEPLNTDKSAREFIVRTTGEIKTLKDVERTVVRANEIGQPITVGQLAKVFFDLEETSVINRTNGIPALSLTVLKKKTADAVDLVKIVKKRMNELKPTLLKDVDVEFINDLSVYVQRRLSILTGNLTIGLALVLLFLPLLIPVRFSLLIAMGEPFAFLGALLILYWMGNSINLISMMGLIIVSGILVDDSIVVTENAVRLIEDEGMDPKEAAIKGTMQILGPVTASVATTAFVFLPMMYMSGIFGKFVKEIPIAVITCLVMSLFETYFILPAHIGHWIKRKGEAGSKPAKKPGIISRFLNWTRDFWENKIVPGYVHWLKFALQKRYLIAVAAFVLFWASILLAAKGMKFILFPPEGVEIFFVRIEAPTGSSLEQTSEITKSYEQLVSELPASELDAYTTSVGLQQQDPNDPFTRRGSEVSQIAVFLTAETARKRTAAEIIEDLREKVGDPKDHKVVFSRVNTGPPQGKPVSIGVRGEKYEQIMPVVKELKEVLANRKGVNDIQDSYTLGKEEILVKVNPAEASAAGLSVASIGNSVRASYEGLVATTVRELDEEIAVRVSLPREERADPTVLEEILLPNQLGNLVPLARVASLGRAQTLSNYEHEHYQRQVKVTAEVDTDVTTSTEVNNFVRDLMPDLRMKHPGISVEFGGEDEDTRESMASLGRAFIYALCGIYLILVLTFKQLLQPLMILITVPLGIISVIWAFFVHGLPLSFMGMVGIIALAGVIVNNAIVFVDFSNQRRQEGAGDMESIIDAGRLRVRPIFLTTITTVIGILPTAYGLGGLDMFVVPIAMALGWGLFFGSMLTAFVFPSSMAIYDDIMRLVRKKFPKLSSLYD
jgi:multidrug efflux pump subunit AcrB